MRATMRSWLWAILLAAFVPWLCGCAHSLEAKRGGSASPILSLAGACPRSRPILAIASPEVKDKFELALAESVADALGHSGCFSQVLQNYQPGRIPAGQLVDLVVQPKIQIVYSDNAAQNWATQWPGVVVFSTWWNGLLYYLDVDTAVSMTDSRSGKGSDLASKDHYDIHYSSGSRGVFSGSVVGWFVLTGVAFLSALVPTYWDDDMRLDANQKIREDYGRMMARKIIQSLDKLPPPTETAAPAES